MLTAPFPTRALAGGYDLDRDLIPPHDRNGWGCLAGLHVLRHLDRLAQSLRLEVALPTDENGDVLGTISDGYGEDVAEHELSGYRLVRGELFGDELLRDARLLPVVGFTAGCQPHWSFEHGPDATRLAEVLTPGRLFAFVGKRIKFAPVPKGGHQFRLHVAAWQDDFPTHSLVSWSNQAEVCRTPAEIEEEVRLGGLELFTAGERW